jgi:hypothetical protein
MPRKLMLEYPSAGDLRAHLLEADTRGVILLPVSEALEQWNAFDQIDVEVAADAMRETMRAEVVQILPGAGLVVRITDRSIGPSEIPSKDGRALPPRVSIEEESEDEPGWDDEEGAYEESTSDASIDAGEDPSDDAGRDTAHAGTPAGSSAISWPIEKLQAEWDTLNTAERIRVARYGNRGARGVVMRGRDKTLLVHLLGNPNISMDEVAALAGTGHLDPAALRRIASNREWMRSSEVTRNLASNPKLPMPEVERLLRTMGRDDLVRLTKSNRTRALVKQAAMKRLKAKAT